MAPIAMGSSPNVVANSGQRKSISIPHSPAIHPGTTGDRVWSEHVNGHDEVDDTTEVDELIDEDDWVNLEPGRKCGELCADLRKQRKPLTQSGFVKRYDAAIKQCLVNPRDNTLIHYIVRRLDAWEFDEHEAFRHLVTTALAHLQTRFGDSGLSSPPVLVDAINWQHFGLIKTICDATKDDKIRGLVAKAIAAETSPSGQNCLHVAIQKNIPLDIVDILIEHGDKTAFSLKTQADGNTPLHEFVKFEPRRFSVPNRKCPVENCKQCLSGAKIENIITDEQQSAKRCVETLRKMIDREPGALSITNNDGKTPYVIHIEQRNRVKPEWKGLEYGDKPERPPADDVPEINRSLLRSASVLNGEPLPPGVLDANTSREQAAKDDRRSKKSTRNEQAGADKRQMPPERTKVASRSEHRDPEWNESRHLAQEVAQELLEQCSSRTDFNEAVLCIFGDQEHSSALGHKVRIAFTAKEALYKNIQEDYQFLELTSILACVELNLCDQQDQRMYEDLNSSNTSRARHDRVEGRGKTPDEQREINMEHLMSILRWLRETKKVRRILKLVIKDSQEFQCRDEHIEECLKGWDIRYLDWNKQNLSLETLQKGETENLVELWLTWNGQNSCLIGWSDAGYGLRKLLPSLHRVHIDVQSSVESVSRLRAYLAAFQQRVTDRFPGLLFEPPGKDILEKGTMGMDGRTRGRGIASVQNKDVSQHRWIQAISEFRKEVVKSLNILPRHNEIRTRLLQNSVRVAVIDDGVNPSRLTSKGSVKEGWPRDNVKIHGNVGTPYDSTEGHGTLMANLVHSVCPYVDLYVAKLGKSPGPYECVAHMAAEAVKWATSQKVHIISMSWTIKETADNQKWADELKTAIENAAKQGITLFCASDDQGMYEHAMALPASTPTTLIKKIGSCDENGNKSHFVNARNVDYLFPGEKLDEVLHDWKGTDKGSSASTALASGLAALILWCSERNGYKKADFENSRMIGLFDKLKVDQKSDSASLVDVTGLLNESRATDSPVKTLIELAREKISDDLRKLEKSRKANGLISGRRSE